MDLTPTRQRILEAILAQRDAGESASLGAIAAAVGLKAPTVHRQLKAMEAEGMVATVGRGLYEVRPYFGGTWIHPDRGLIARWSSGEPMRWRFPLVSRVPDLRAQRVLYRLLREAEWKGFLHPWLVEKGPRRGKARTRKAGEPETADEAVWGARRFDYGMTLVAYGSCARGDAGASSDLDLLLIQPVKLDVGAAWRGLVAEANLWAERQVGLRVAARDAFFDLPKPILEGLRKDGITVFSSFGEDGEWIESAWDPDPADERGTRGTLGGDL